MKAVLMMQRKIFIGTSGWNYQHWIEKFYPKQLHTSKWLNYYCKYFNTVEINNTFYHLPQSKTFSKWYDETSEDFCFSLKVSRFFTHIKRLKDPIIHMNIFMERAEKLKDKLRILLFQLPPKMKFDYERIKDLIMYLKSFNNSSIRYVFEFRNKSWLNDKLYELFQKYDISLCLSDYPLLEVIGPITSKTIYIRKHGKPNLYASEYSLDDIKKLSIKMGEWAKEGKEIYVYFNNDAYGYAIKNAMQLKKLISSKED